MKYTNKDAFLNDRKYTFISKPRWDYFGWIIDRSHDIMVAIYIILALFAPPRYLTLYPLILMIMVLNWYDLDGSCWVTKLAQWSKDAFPYNEAWKYNKVTTQNTARYQNTGKGEEQQEGEAFHNPVQHLFKGENDEEKLANKAAFLSLYFMCIWCFLAWWRVCHHYKLPFLEDSPMRYFVAFYFFGWLFTTLFV